MTTYELVLVRDDLSKEVHGGLDAETAMALLFRRFADLQSGAIIAMSIMSESRRYAAVLTSKDIGEALSEAFRVLRARLTWRSAACSTPTTRRTGPCTR